MDKKIIARREVISKPGDKVTVTQLHLTEEAAKHLRIRGEIPPVKKKEQEYLPEYDEMDLPEESDGGGFLFYLVAVVLFLAAIFAMVLLC